MTTSYQKGNLNVTICVRFSHTNFSSIFNFYDLNLDDMSKKFKTVSVFPSKMLINSGFLAQKRKPLGSVEYSDRHHELN